MEDKLPSPVDHDDCVFTTGEQTRGHWPTLKEQAAALEQSEPENMWKWYRAVTLRMNEYLLMHK